MVYSMYDRMIVGGARPVGGMMKLEAIDPLKAPYFLTRREMGIFNVGGPGVVKAGDAVFELDYKEALYLGSGDREVTFESKDVKNPAQFYFNSVTAHRNYPDKKVTKADAIVAEMGSLRVQPSLHQQDAGQSGIAYLPVADGNDRTETGKCVEHHAGARAQPPYGSLLLFRSAR